jgi:hypothetical protein
MGTMCCTLGPAVLSSTILYGARVIHDDSVVHVLGYQNKASSFGPNAMILPVPAARKLSQANMLDMQEFPGVLLDYEASYRRPMMLSADSVVGSALRGAKSVEVFSKGSYTVVLAEDALDIMGALERVPADRRIKNPNPKIFEAYSRMYPGWPIAVCCWSGELEPEPLVWWYEPMFKDRLFLPALDAHDGEPPNPRAKVKLDHMLVWGAQHGEQTARFRRPVPETLQPFFVPRFNAMPLKHQQMINGDFWINLSGKGLPERCMPPEHRVKLDWF